METTGSEPPHVHSQHAPGTALNDCLSLVGVEDGHRDGRRSESEPVCGHWPGLLSSVKTGRMVSLKSWFTAGWLAEQQVEDKNEFKVKV